ncbi:MAG: hypothetical protein Kow00129_07390 [Thermoleophilia bacterium]
MACGARRKQDELVRFHLEEAGAGYRVVPDREGPRIGRGAYLCPRRVCLEQALRRRAFNRAFRRTVTFDEEELRRAIGGRMEELEES